MLILASAVAAAPQIGDKAPKIKIAEWMTSKPPALPGEPGAEKHVFLVEFWATWCGPCLKSIPHLGELQKKHEKDGLVVIGVSNEEPDTIAKFIKDKMKMAYFVGSDDEMATTEGWTKDISTIPHAFLVNREGVVVWQGNPLADVAALDKAVEQVLAGKYDIEAAKREAEKEKAYRGLMEEARTAFGARDADKMLKLFDQMIEMKPKELQPYLIKRQILREFDKADQVPEWEGRILEVFKDSSDDLISIAEYELESELSTRSPRFLVNAALRAGKISKEADSRTLAVIARVHHELGLLDQAIATQSKALAAAADDEKQEHQRTLDYYKTMKQLQLEPAAGSPTAEKK